MRNSANTYSLKRVSSVEKKSKFHLVKETSITFIHPEDGINKVCRNVGKLIYSAWLIAST
jgi:hypothetical protein